MADPLTLGLIMAGVGALKTEAVDRPAANRQRTLAATQERTAPWTGLHGKAPVEPNAFGQAMQYGMAGAAAGRQGGTSETVSPGDGEELVNGSPAQMGSGYNGPTGPLSPEYGGYGSYPQGPLAPGKNAYGSWGTLLRNS